MLDHYDLCTSMIAAGWAFGTGFEVGRLVEKLLKADTGFEWL